MEKQFVKSSYEMNKNNNIILNGISVIGERNKKANNPNQDAFGITLSDKAALIAVADGLGSCKNSNIGSEYAIECITEWMINDLERYEVVSDEMLVILNNKLINRWKYKLSEVNYLTYDTTILYAIYIENYLIVGGLGDGMILCHYDDKTYDLSWDKNEFSNTTISIGSKNSKELIRSKIISISEEKLPVTVLLMTDGISDDLNVNSKQELPKYLNSKLKEVGIEQLQSELIEWILNWKTQGHTDDRTLCMLNID